MQLLDAAAEVGISAKFGFEIRLEDLLRQFNAHNPGADTEQVDIIMLNRLVRRVDIMTKGRAHPWRLVASNRRADAGAADENAPFHRPCPNLCADTRRYVREVNRVGAMGARVRHFMPPGAQPLNDGAFQRKTGVIAADG